MPFIFADGYDVYQDPESVNGTKLTPPFPSPNSDDFSTFLRVECPVCRVYITCGIRLGDSCTFPQVSCPLCGLVLMRLENPVMVKTYLPSGTTASWTK